MATKEGGGNGLGKIINPKETGREIYKQAENVRKDVIKRLFDTADNIRHRTKNVEAHDRDDANRIARNLEQTANYLNSRALDQMEDTTETLREHVWETTMVAFLIGLIIGLLVGSSKD